MRTTHQSQDGCCLRGGRECASCSVNSSFLCHLPRSVTNPGRYCEWEAACTELDKLLSHGIARWWGRRGHISDCFQPVSLCGVGGSIWQIGEPYCNPPKHPILSESCWQFLTLTLIPTKKWKHNINYVSDQLNCFVMLFFFFFFFSPIELMWNVTIQTLTMRKASKEKIWNPQSAITNTCTYIHKQ